jgi:hypothetical protein
MIQISKTKFDYLWRCFHTSYTAGPQDETTNSTTTVANNDSDTEGDDYANEEAHLGGDSFSGDDESDDEQQPTQPPPTWYFSIQDFVEHVNKVSQKLCKHPSWRISIDEMLRKFKGRSAQTYRMKRKPDKEGYKFFALACATTGYIYSFHPDGRLESSSNAKTLEAVEKLVRTIPRADTLEYLLAMDNYFTQPAVIEMTRRYGIGVCGTARRQRYWPPTEYKRVTDKRFNTVYFLPDRRDFLMMRWVDNDVVDMVTTAHNGLEMVPKFRKRPRENQINRKHVREVWGAQPVKEIDIPVVIDDYNNCIMGGVDKAYQLISGYKPTLRCRRIWMPMWLHCLDVCRVNAYIIAKEKKVVKTQKDFVLDWIIALNHRAKFIETTRTRKAVAELISPVINQNQGKPKKARMSHTKPSLPSYRFSGKPEDHVAVIAKKQLSCTYCRYACAVAKLEGTSLVPPPVSRTLKKCLICGDHLCTQHFDLFHAEQNENEY